MNRCYRMNFEHIQDIEEKHMPLFKLLFDSWWNMDTAIHEQKIWYSRRLTDKENYILTGFIKSLILIERNELTDYKPKEETLT